MSNRLIVLTGCSGGGKSTLLEELRRRGHAVVGEPGRRIVAEELVTGGSALPWRDLAAFARRAIAMAIADRAAVQDRHGLVFFDRSLIDAAAALEAAKGKPVLAALAAAHRYDRTVFLAPPWPEIYAGDDARRHGFDEAKAEYDRLATAYPALGYDVVVLPKLPVAARADFLLSRL